jgi:Cu+-exporting ATPase
MNTIAATSPKTRHPAQGMSIEPTKQKDSASEYICPMHPQIVGNAPGNCPVCGMTLELRVASATEEANPELHQMTLRFWVSAALALPVLVVSVSESMFGNPLYQLASARFWTWFELVMATPVVLWGGWPFFVRGWQSIVNRGLNMFTLISLGLAVSYGYSLVAALLPGIFPPAFRDASGGVAVYFEAAAVITNATIGWRSPRDPIVDSSTRIGTPLR